VLAVQARTVAHQLGVAESDTSSPQHPHLGIAHGHQSGWPWRDAWHIAKAPPWCYLRLRILSNAATPGRCAAPCRSCCVAAACRIWPRAASPPTTSTYISSKECSHRTALIPRCEGMGFASQGGKCVCDFF